MRKWFKTKSAAEDKVQVNWERLTDVGQLDELDAASQRSTVLIFKHSTRCGISSMMLRRFEVQLAQSDVELKYYLLDLITYRDLSNAISERYRVMHESPQLLVVRNANLVHHASHYEIDLQAVNAL